MNNEQLQTKARNDAGLPVQMDIAVSEMFPDKVEV